MPNWVENTVTIKGELNDLLALINLGLKNSHAEEVKADVVTTEVVQSAINKLYDKGIYRCGDNGGNYNDKKPYTIKEERGVNFSTFLPIPDTFLKFDTTNYESEFKDEADKQKKEYGVVGWYDYNCEYFGCKWDSEVRDLRFNTIKYGDNKYKLSFQTTTPWSPPLVFIKRLKELFPNLDFYICYIEEMGESAGYFKILGKEMIGDDLTHFFAETDEQNEDVDFDSRYEISEDKVYDAYYRFVDSN